MHYLNCSNIGKKIKSFSLSYEVLAQLGFLSGSAEKNPPVGTGDTGSVPGWGRSPGEGNGNPLQYGLGKPMDGGAWQATVHRVAKYSNMI